ncbi:repressor LexA [Candidatus Peregrinibacteria bacterium CG22_combo_CG10-13_8_21_14_all_44_10]|nr:MAG: repressor LexA [Candidatus Peregrinibacteria bacterium CG2_30_44_17]PIP65940.1 MAG: repressor LexA [Candidatus Peregrinibacteria bacterium CG22_combo_CG10-13_8_21_14_all_44_10]PIS04155.1 MAG: repressor LexA [Candidatus Peregrinibacteria bacterium CG10_big_fil_rev_8_21_14_0_10_44_7]PJB89257.1 MAG: repressor LexA [Candidatus Peregrinibacteria bacterium CG_4_9_14_0_8_um_filter_44_15]
MLTEKQSALLKFIGRYQMENGASPTIKEMREHFGVSSDNSILKHLNALQEKGEIEKGDTPRSIKMLGSVREIMETAKNIVSLPILSTIPAGGATIGEQEEIGRMELGSDMVKRPDSSFILRVTGESMEGAGIFAGDHVIVGQGIEPKVGDIVVALVDGGSTLKSLVKTGGKYYLQAENPAYEDIHPLESLEVQGVVTGLIRSYL